MLGLGDLRLYMMLALSHQRVEFGHKVIQFPASTRTVLREGIPRQDRLGSGAWGKVPSPHSPNWTDPHVAAFPAPLISHQAPAPAAAGREAMLSHGHISIRQPASSLGRSGGVLTFLWESCAALVGSDFPPYDRVF